MNTETAIALDCAREVMMLLEQKTSFCLGTGWPRALRPTVWGYYPGAYAIVEYLPTELPGVRVRVGSDEIQVPPGHLIALEHIKTSNTWDYAPVLYRFEDGLLARPEPAVCAVEEAEAVAAAAEEWDEEAIRDYIESCDEYDEKPEGQLLAMFRSVYGRSPGHEEWWNMWDHICAGVSHR